MDAVALAVALRDEIDIVGAWLEYHLACGVDLIFATDHRSMDGTSDVLQAYARGGRVRVVREEGPGYEQSRWATTMANAARAAGVGWLIHLDVDEFVWPNRESLHEVFAVVPAQVGKVFLGRRNFLPTRAESAPFWRRCVVRERVALNRLGRPLPPKVAHRGQATVAVHMGCHDVEGAGEGTHTAALELLHFPIRSWVQYSRKVVVGADALDANPTLPEEVGVTWRRAREAHQAGRLRAEWEALVRRVEVADPADVVVDRRLADWFEAR